MFKEVNNVFIVKQNGKIVSLDGKTSWTEVAHFHTSLRNEVIKRVCPINTLCKKKPIEYINGKLVIVWDGETKQFSTFQDLLDFITNTLEIVYYV